MKKIGFRLVSWLTGKNYDCLMIGHKKFIVDGSKSTLANVDHDENVINYFNGRLEICMRKGCTWERFIGSKTPVRCERIRSEIRCGD
jgi:hypothetical protein